MRAEEINGHLKSWFISSFLFSQPTAALDANRKKSKGLFQRFTTAHKTKSRWREKGPWVKWHTRAKGPRGKKMDFWSAHVSAGIVAHEYWCWTVSNLSELPTEGRFYARMIKFMDKASTAQLMWMLYSLLCSIRDFKVSCICPEVKREKLNCSASLFKPKTYCNYDFQTHKPTPPMKMQHMMFTSGHILYILPASMTKGSFNAFQRPLTLNKET